MKIILIFILVFFIHFSLSAQVVFTYNITSPVCYGGLNGEITVNVTGAMPPLHYEWSVPGAADTNVLQGLSVGYYYLTLTHSGGQEIDSVFLPDNTPVILNLFPHNTSCSGKADGQIQTTVSGGVPPYSYSWASGAVSTSMLNIEEGMYAVTVTDSLGCPAYAEAIVETDQELTTIDTIRNISCWAGGDGIINITATGGTFPYVFVWDMTDSVFTDTASVWSIVDSLNVKTFYVTITDSIGCSISKQYKLISPSAISAGETHVNNICKKGSSGSITAWAQGGSGGFSYSWSNGLTGSTVTGLSAGTYTVVIRDAHGCSVRQSIDILEPFKGILADVEVTDVSCRDQHDGMINVSYIDNATQPCQLLWSNSKTENFIDNLDGGSYMFTITDANNCQLIDTFIVNVPDIDCIEIYTCFSPNNDGFNDVWNIKNIHLYPACEVLIYNQWSQELFKSKGYSVPWDGVFSGESLPAATYYYVVTLGDSRYKPYKGAVTIVK